jgi:hypothetical protein
VNTRPIPIPPLSVVRLARADRHTPGWKKDVGRVFRIGYYSQNDGLDCVWLVNDEGTYEQTTDHDYLYRYYDVITFGKTKNWFGRGRPLIPPILHAAPTRSPAPRRRAKRGHRDERSRTDRQRRVPE